MATIQGVYVALFGRPADPFGLAYWQGVTNDGADLAQITDLAQTPEYQERFAGQSYTQVVNSIYQSLFGRDAEVAGLTFWVQGLQNGTFTVNDVAIRILDGATGDDRTIVDNKIAAADLFTASLDTAAEIIAYDGTDAADFGRAFLANVTDTVPTQAEVDAAVNQLVTEGPGQIGDTFTLTTDADNFVGTANDDEFNAIAGGDDATLNNFDKIDGGAGVDTLNIIANANVAVPTGATIKNVEIINVINEDNNEVAVSGFQGAQQIWQIGGAGAARGLANGQTAGFRNTDANAGAAPILVAATATATSVSIALDGAGAAVGDDTVGEVAFNVTGAKVTTLSVSGTIADDGKLSLINLPTGLKTVNIALDSDSDIAAYSGAGATGATTVLTTVTTIDASASTGNLTVGLAGLESLDAETILLGSGNDSVSIATDRLDAEEVTIGLGAGNDSLLLRLAPNDATDVVISTGAGDDVINLVGGNLVVNDDEDGFDGSVTITDFAAASDSLLVAGFNGFTAKNLVNAAVADAESLYEAVSALDAILGGEGANITNFATFSFGGNTYFYGDISEGDGLDGDLLIELTGAVDLNNDNVASLFLV